MSAEVRCLFLTRKYPPAVGGMETLAAATARARSPSPSTSRWCRSDAVNVISCGGFR